MVKLLAVLTLVLTVALSAGMATLAHQYGFVHFHILGGVPVGGILIGVGAAAGIAASIRLRRSYEAPRWRILAQFSGVAVYAGAVILDSLILSWSWPPIKPGTPVFAEAMNYLRSLIEQSTIELTAELPQWTRIPPALTLGLVILRLTIEMIATIVAAGWLVTLATEAPFCWRDRRFYELRQLVESSNSAAVREWEGAVSQSRPLEAKAIMSRMRAGKVDRRDRAWMRLVVHQCPVCLATRVRVERRRRLKGIVRTEPYDELKLDSVRGASLSAN